MDELDTILYAHVHDGFSGWGVTGLLKLPNVSRYSCHAKFVIPTTKRNQEPLPLDNSRNDSKATPRRVFRIPTVKSSGISQYFCEIEMAYKAEPVATSREKLKIPYGLGRLLKKLLVRITPYLSGLCQLYQAARRDPPPTLLEFILVSRAQPHQMALVAASYIHSP
jgi:hypothetical protein